MNFYRIVFTNMEVLVAATDTDMAVMKAQKENPVAGDLMALALLDKRTGLAENLMLNGEMPKYLEADKKVLEFIRKERLKALPKRRQAGMTLSYCDGDLFVTFFGYSASLAVAANEGELHPTSMNRYEEYQLTPKQQRIVNEWERFQDEYYELNGWATWADLYDN